MADAKHIPEWWVPTAWPISWRRAFLLTLPISGPLWVACIVISFLGLAGFAILMMPILLPVFGLMTLKEKLWDTNPGETVPQFWTAWARFKNWWRMERRWIFPR